MTAKTTTNVWFVIANSYQARLLTGSQTPTGRCRLSEVDAIESPIPTHQTTKAYGTHGGSRYSYADNLRAVKEGRRRFAVQLSRWVNEVFKQRKVQRLTIFVPPNLIGYLRDHLHQEHLEQIDLRQENLMYMTDDALRRHQAITGLLLPRTRTKPKIRPTKRFDQHSPQRIASQSRSGARGPIPLHAAH